MNGLNLGNKEKNKFKYILLNEKEKEKGMWIKKYGRWQHISHKKEKRKGINKGRKKMIKQ